MASLAEDRIEKAKKMGASGAWRILPALSVPLAAGGLFFAWKYLALLADAGEISNIIFSLSFAGFLFLALAVPSGLFIFLRVFFLSRTVSKTLSSENEMLRLVVEGVNDGVWDWDISAKKISFSVRWLDMFGFGRDGLSTDPSEWIGLVHPDDLIVFEEALAAHLGGRSPFFRTEHRLRTQGGGYKWVLVRGRAVLNGRKEPIRLAGSTTDISHLKTIEEVLKGQTEELAQEKARSDALIASIGEGLVATDGEGKIIVMHEQAAAMLGKSVRESLGRRFADVFPKEENEKEEIVPADSRPIMRALAEKKKVAAIIYHIRPDGRKFPAAVTASPILLEGKTAGAIAVFRDITKEREVDKAKTEFVSLASHQLRTPLSAIRWYSEMLITEKLGPLNEEQRGYIKEVYQSGRRMIDLVNSLLNVSRIELGTFMVEPEETDMVAVCESVLLELSVKSVEKGLAIERRYEENFPRLNVDPKLMRIIFQNFLSNAMKYTPEHGAITISIGRSPENSATDSAGAMMRISVRDTGIGIPEEVRDHIFTKLFRADNARLAETEGTGLGLYVVKAIAESSGGRVWFEPNANANGTEAGTTFFAELPLSGMRRIAGAKDLI